MAHDVEAIPLSQAQAYESAMQYVVISDNNDSCDRIDCLINRPALLTNLFRSTVERCSLVRRMVRVVAVGDSYEDVANAALKNGSFEDMMENGVNADATWSIRLRRYGSGDYRSLGRAESNNIDRINYDGDTSVNPNVKRKWKARYGKKVRSSITDESNAILSMSELTKFFQGKVNLVNPDCQLYLLEGLRDSSLRNSGSEEEYKVLLSRVIANGPKVRMEQRISRQCNNPVCIITLNNFLFFTKRHPFTLQKQGFASPPHRFVP
jgi:hypothetical protein